MAEQASNEEVLRRGFRAFSEGRFDDTLETMAPEIEWHVAFRLPDLPTEQKVLHGHEEVRELWRQFTSVWERLVFDPQEILYDEGETAIVRIRIQAMGGESRVEVDRTLFYVLTIRDGLLRRIVPFDSADEAADAAGVEL